jgi:hypothetical protein
LKFKKAGKKSRHNEEERSEV